MSGTLTNVTINSDYSGRITLSGPLTTIGFSMDGGILDQPSAPNGTDLTVTGFFHWGGGTINSTGNTANVNILGNGGIAPANDGTVTTGSTFNFIGTDARPTTTLIEPGTLQFNNAARAVVGYAATVRVDVIASRPGSIIGFGQAGANLWDITNNGSLEYRGVGTASTNMPINNSSGLFKLNGQVTVTLSGGDMTTAGYGQSNNAASKLHIVNGSTLVATNGVRIDGGSVFLIMNSDLPANQQTATINGKFFMTGGTIIFSAPIGIGTDPLVYGTFTVNGDVGWSGGTYMPSVDYTTAGLANKWIVNGTMTSAAACILQPNPQRGQNPPPSSVWTVLDATATAGNMPTLPQGSPLTLGEFSDGNRKLWKLTS